MTKTTYMIQMNDLEAAEKLRELAKLDLRSIGNEVAWLVHHECSQRFDYEDSPVTELERTNGAKA